jgi:hypothetical protein
MSAYSLKGDFHLFVLDEPAQALEWIYRRFLAMAQIPGISRTIGDGTAESI